MDPITRAEAEVRSAEKQWRACLLNSDHDGCRAEEDRLKTARRRLKAMRRKFGRRKQ